MIIADFNLHLESITSGKDDLCFTRVPVLDSLVQPDSASSGLVKPGPAWSCQIQPGFLPAGAGLVHRERSSSSSLKQPVPTCSLVQSHTVLCFFFLHRVVFYLFFFSQQALGCVRLLAIRPHSRAANARTGSGGGSGAGRKEGKKKDSVKDKLISLGSCDGRNRAKKLRAHFQTKEPPLDCCTPFLSLHSAL